MNNWKAFLNTQGAQWDSEGVSSFGPAQATGDQTLLCDLSHYGLLSIKGPDSSKFLQGQLTCDVRELINSSRLGAHCSPKGRMISSFRATQINDSEIVLRLHQGLLPTLQQALGKYIVFSKAELSDCSDHYRLIGLCGPQAETLLMQHLGSVPKAINETYHCEQGHIIKVAEQRFECWIKCSDTLCTEAKELWQSLAEDCTLAGHPAWTLADIRDGIGEVRLGLEEELIPQMLNYQVLDGISFNKGCYTGQEIVARMTYLGKLKRHMYRASLEGTELPPVGSDIFSQSSQQSVGKIVMCAPSESLDSEGLNNDTRNSEVLAVITEQAVLADDIWLDTERTKKLKPLSLPYAITSD